MNEKHTPPNDKHTPKNDKHALPGGKGIHIGYTLGRLLNKLGITFPELGQRMGIAPQNARAMLKKKYLHAATMVKISEALQHDIIRYLYLPENLPGNPAMKQRMEELEKENQSLKEKITDLKEINALLKK